ncbi:hypothetical protein HHI36_016084 [Cryptolaemus montrouzieri]|uniref:FUN14 domain-containing protein 1 n=1 Tax=Cryptolaemus montrouzieri TaxID=559131 RepID=A0ABD2N8C0_9CUCU
MKKTEVEEPLNVDVSAKYSVSQGQNIQENVREVKSGSYFDFSSEEEIKRAETYNMSEAPKIDVNEKMKEPKSEIFDLNEAKAALNRLGNNLKISTFPRQIGLGTSTGILAGFLSMKVGRLSALAIGGGILLYEVAHHNKIVTKDLETVSKQIRERNYLNNPKAKKALDMLNYAKKFAGRNKIFSVGFIGGFLLGTGINQ